MLTFVTETLFLVTNTALYYLSSLAAIGSKANNTIIVQ